MILELVGSPNFPANFEAIAPCGRIAIVGIGAGAEIDFSLRDLMYKRVRMFGTVMRARSLEEKAVMTRGVEKAVLPGFVSGDLSVFVAETYPARPGGRRLRALSGRRQARQDRARDVSQLVGVHDGADRVDLAL